MAIGVFDSGVGGLTVHHALVDRLKTADFVFLADQANMPYGGRPGEEIVTLTRRSEEHTSELQSQFHLVCRLLLEKKKKKQHASLIKTKKQINIEKTQHN